MQVALRKCSEQVALRKCSAPVARSVQVGLCKLLCASAVCKCSVQFAERKLLCASDSAQVALRKCCRSCRNVLRVLFLYLKVAIVQPELRECAPRTTLHLKIAIFQPELQEHAPRTTFVLKSCDFQAGCGGVLRVLRLHLKVATFQPELREHAPHTTSVLKSYDFPAGAGARNRGIAKIARDHSSRQIRTGPQREHFDTHDLRRGFVKTKTNSHGATARALRRARSPQRVARAPQKS